MTRVLVRAVWLAAVFVGSVEHAVGREIVYAALGYGRVEKFELDGTLIGGFTTTPPISMAVDDVGYTYISSLPLTRVLRYRPGGGFDRIFATPTSLDSDTTTLNGGFAIGPDGISYLGASTPTVRIERFDKDGSSIGYFVVPPHTLPTGLVSDIAFDSDGYLYATTDRVIRKFDDSGAQIGTFVRSSSALDIALDSRGHLFAVSHFLVTEFGPAGNLLNSFNPGFRSSSIAIDSRDVLYIGGYQPPAGSVNDAVLRTFDSNGTLLSIFTEVSPTRRDNNVVTDLIIVNEVPEPASVLLLLAGLIGFVSTTRRR